MNNIGTIILVHSDSNRAKSIQKFQSIDDPESGYYNHSGLYISINGIPYIYEMAEVKDRKIKAAAKFTPLEEYSKNKYDLLYLQPNFEFDIDKYIKIALSYSGTPYGYGDLLFNIPRSILWNRITDPKDKHPDKYFGPKDKRAEKNIVCHMLSMLIWNKYSDGKLFPEWYTGKVSLLYNDVNFKSNRVINY